MITEIYLLLNVILIQSKGADQYNRRRSGVSTGPMGKIIDRLK